MRDSHEKGAGMRDLDPPFQTLIIKSETITVVTIKTFPLVFVRLSNIISVNQLIMLNRAQFNRIILLFFCYCPRAGEGQL